MSNITAQIIQDSVNGRWGKEARITTFLLEYPRYIHSELMTHRCLASDTRLVFDLPAGKKTSGKRKYTMTIGDFCHKWNYGAAEHRAARARTLPLEKILPDAVYSAGELAEVLAIAVSSIRGACRSGALPTQNGNKTRAEDYRIRGQDYIAFRNAARGRTYDMKPRLRKMRLRMLNEDTGAVEHTSVTDCWEVGERETLTIAAGGYSVTTTLDHLILTAAGWKEAQDITLEDSSVVTATGVEEKRDPLRFKKLEGRWVSRWTQEQRARLTALQQGHCYDCGEHKPLEVHHVEPIHVNPSRAFDESNITALCATCHKRRHASQDWQEGVDKALRGRTTRVDSITPAGVQKVYDLSVASEFHNFVANDIVVHNCFSRNAASSRAIPVETLVQQTIDNPVTPIHWGQNQPGMVAAEELPEDLRRQANKSWRSAAYQARHHARDLARLGVHKQVANRVLEPFQHIRVLLTGTDFENFFALRTHADAQPEIQRLARMMRKAYYNAEPMQLYRGEWHVPYVERVRDVMGTLRYYIDGLELDAEEALKVSASAAAQTSYRKNDLTLDKAEAIYRRLVTAKPVHASPFEHQATPLFWARSRCRNFRGWKQYRTFIAGETVHDHT